MKITNKHIQIKDNNFINVKTTLMRCYTETLTSVKYLVHNRNVNISQVNLPANCAKYNIN